MDAYLFPYLGIAVAVMASVICLFAYQAVMLHFARKEGYHIPRWPLVLLPVVFLIAFAIGLLWPLLFALVFYESIHSAVVAYRED